MAAENVLISTVFLLIIEACSVFSQARVEYINQPCPSPTVCSASFIKAAPQLMVPAVIKPVIQPCDCYIQATAPSVPNINFGGYPGYYPCTPGPMPMPPIIVESDDDDDYLYHLLYFLIFAMRNRSGCGCGCGGNCGGNCGCGCGVNFNNGCGCGCGGGCNCFKCCCPNMCCCCNDCCCCNKCCCCNNGCYSYFPYPIPVPMNRYCFGGCGTDTTTTDDGTCYANGQSGINLYICADSS